ncbi:hypothetical protein I540_2614 [Mycobacteroides abscessus subsp. bolletii 1513]|uniref:Uncharacterized protein n=1 Tax=Mycobacteroides abscessus subsp. bolletii 1513 TaxID=1299321 RepID=X8DS05_9MYCO|nr:hypothetical protein I540_2614 [Mycobacteroides abscessus subsp. bolletii 1513]
MAQASLVVQAMSERPDPQLVTLAYGDVRPQRAVDGFVNAAAGHTQSAQWPEAGGLVQIIAFVGRETPQPCAQYLFGVASRHCKPFRAWMAMGGSGHVAAQLGCGQMVGVG